eukprot:TRINITY_DN6779_c0_g2_i1.p1 TRINITY_DN6779_c0_g2~~TRINITY_DN6779_c0_g2_i1.p1  ORF type:complete len:290 (+),score=51.96 TRINITY_DN6779_c0_g2_i1:31-900(+)
MFTTVVEVLPHGLRLYEERVLRHVNIAVALGCLVCIVVTITEVAQKADKTVNDFWTPGGDFKLNGYFEAALKDSCEYQGTVNLGEFDMKKYTIDENSRGFLMALTCGLIRRALLISASAVFLTFLNKIGFNYNWHDVRYGSYIVEKSFLLLLEVIFIVWAIIALKHPQSLASDLETYIKLCSRDTIPTHVFTTPPYIAMFVAHGVTLFVYIVNAFLLLSNSTRQVPPQLISEWGEITAILEKCPKHSTLPEYLCSSLEREVNGVDGQPGVKHLLATEYNYIDPDAFKTE